MKIGSRVGRAAPMVAGLCLFVAPHGLRADDPAPQNSWILAPSITLSGLYFNRTGSPELAENRGRYTAHIVGTDALSWPDGRSALITTIELRGITEDLHWLYRCVNYKDANFSDTGEVCWQLKTP
jgi:hypothetical protein